MSLTARTDKFRKGMISASQRIKGFAADVAASAKRVAVFGAATAAAAVGGLAVLVKRSMQTIDTTTKMADRLGMATEALSGLHHAARLTGVGTEKLNMGLQRMVRRVAEAAQETGEAKDAIKELGLDAKKLTKQAPDKQFKAIAERMKLVGSQSDRVRLAFKLFDSEGVALVNTLREGATGIEAMQRDAQKLGLTFSRIDAAQIEAAQDAMARLGGAIKGLSNTLAIKLAPFIEAVAQKLVSMASTGSGMSTHVVDAFGFVIEASAKLWDTLEYGIAAFKMLQAGATASLLGIMRPLEIVAKGFLKFSELVGLKVGEDFTNWMEVHRKGFEAATIELSREAIKHWERARAGEQSRAAREFIAEIRKNAREAAQAAAAAIDSAATFETSVPATIKRQRGEARQIRLDREFIGQVGPGHTGRRPEISAPKVEALLEKIAAQGTAVAMGAPHTGMIGAI